MVVSRGLLTLFLVFSPFVPLAVGADTYDTHTLVAIEATSAKEVKLLYNCRADIVGRERTTFKALLTVDQMKEFADQGLKITVL